MDEMISFYETYFDYRAERCKGDRIVELIPRAHGVPLLLHPAGKATREGQVAVKLVFDIENVPDFCVRAAKVGLSFGPIHNADGYCFANAKDPAKNSVSVSSRAFRGPSTL
ncbi:VOC family protein [Phaeobacter gallaeciensis]|uniref:VOC family protein n=3 Tax=Rhodobacterales TaxID=204455 RepID=A0A366X892_9RHOB|nr:VOC family protein [Phaeobacter gallaeciensis]RBW61461.1 VOC family protein [Phaeobacter gallaeciensis]